MKPNFTKENGLLPVIVQDSISLRVLMLGYMNDEAFTKTMSEKRVTFFSRSKNRLWTKGETSGNYLNVQDVRLDCDQDAILISAVADGPTCHTGSESCFGNLNAGGFIYSLEKTISGRIAADDPDSYTNKLFKRGINKIAQKVGEEAVELVIESKDQNDELFLNEAADLIYHFLILLKAKNKSLRDVEAVLSARSK